MKPKVLILVLASIALCTAVPAQEPPSFTPEQLAERALQRSAVEAVVWGMPAVNLDLMRQAAIKAHAAQNEIVYWSRLPDWQNQTLTPNPDSIYLMTFINTKDVGPMVIEIPPANGGSINGTIMDAWQTPLEDVGPAGVDKGKGGKYLILPPGYKEKAPADYIVLPSLTYQGYALLRSILADGDAAYVSKAAEYGKRIKVYPLSQAKNPPETKFVDVIDVIYDSTIRYDVSFFESLDRVVQAEPWLVRDMAMIDTLKAIGIEKGRQGGFASDQKTQAILNAAAAEAHALLEARYQRAFTQSYFDFSRWALPASAEYMKASATGYADLNSYPIQDRGSVFSFAFFTPKHIGEGQFYLMTIHDKDGRDLNGAETYRLNVPAKVPVTLYWSATVYDRATHGLIRGQDWSSRSSQTPGLKKNADGSVDIYFGPQAPAGKASNWIPTDPKVRFEVLFRFYGPGKPLFDKTWKLTDIEKS